MLIASLSHVRLFATPQTVAHQAFLSMEFFRQEYWSGPPRRSPGDLPHPGIKLASLTSPALAGKFLTTSATLEAPVALGLRGHCSKAVSELRNKCMLIHTYINIYLYAYLCLLKLLSSSSSKSSKSSPKDLGLFSSFTYSYAILWQWENLLHYP